MQFYKYAVIMFNRTANDIIWHNLRTTGTTIMICVPKGYIGCNVIQLYIYVLLGTNRNTTLQSSGNRICCI